MIRNLARCPYCGDCEVALDDASAVVCNPDSSARPCPHLAWVDGRYSQFERSPQGVPHLIGSSEFRWGPPGPVENIEELVPYLKELANQGQGWPFAPPVPFVLRPLTAEGQSGDAAAEAASSWDIDGCTVFAQDPSAFWAALPDCQQRQLEGLRIDESEEE